MAKKIGAPGKSDIVAQICKDAELSRKQVGAVSSHSMASSRRASVATVCSRCLAC